MHTVDRKRIAALALAAILLNGSASAIFGMGKQKSVTVPEEGAPVAQDLSISTYRGVPYEAQLLAYDSEGDDMTFSVVEEPKKGTVTIDGANFVYTPKENASGADRFTFAVTDSNGFVSSPATVTITIEKVKSGVMYADTDEATATAAQWMAEEGIFTGAKIGENYYFEPDRQVSRSEFVAMLMETTQRDVTAVTKTGFSDDTAIPTWAKAYAAAGVADGILKGKETEDGAAFLGTDPISFDEAATMLNRVLDLGDVELEVWYADREPIPSWAAQAVGNMEAMNVLSVGCFGSDMTVATVTRADAARMLSAAKTLLDGEQTESWLRLW
ncbi:MAG: cadherin-like domain-containing protein [Oscillibacter sp.]|nr:cadherin-like domain-containing protein [Oscillibacter sp.]